MVYAISAGPLADVTLKRYVRDVLDRAVVITVRDRRTRALLEDLGLARPIIVTADPALLLAAEPLSIDDIITAEAIDPRARLIGFSVREPGPAAPTLDVEHYHQLVATAADFMIDRLDAEAVFFPFERRGLDVQHSHSVVGRMSHAPRATVLKRVYSPGQMLSLLNHFELTIGMRLHFLVFSALADVPFVPLPYASKVNGFLEELELDVPALEDLSAGKLIANIDRAWDTRAQLREHVRARLPALQQRAAFTTELAVRLLEEPHRLKEDSSWQELVPQMY
jgi:polysaccharide pyruvyl transferase WcaK-like protein